MMGLGSVSWQNGVRRFSILNKTEASGIRTYLALIVCQGLHHDLRLVVDGQDNLGHASLGKRLNLVAQDRLVAKVDQRLGHGEGHRAESRAVATNENQGLHSTVLLL